jgi:hypothetical protein
VVRRPEAGAAGARPGLTVLAAHGQAALARDFQHHVAHRRIEADVVVAVEVRGSALEQLLEAVELRLHLCAHVGSLGDGGRPARIAHEAPASIDERAAAGERLAEREVDVHPEPEPAVARAGDEVGSDLARHEDGGARHDAVAMRGEDALAHPAGEAVVVGVDDEPSRHGRRPSMARRSTVAGTSRPASVPSRSIARRCSMRS